MTTAIKRPLETTEGSESGQVSSAQVVLRRVFLQALSALKTGEIEQLEAITAQINSNGYSAAHISQLLDCMSVDVALLGAGSGIGLVSALLKLSWIDHANSHPQFNDSIITFFSLLVSALPKWWNEVVRKLLHEFSQGKDLTNHHLLLRKLIHLVPTGTNSLPKLIKSCFPNKNSSSLEMCNYTRNLLLLTEYFPEMEITAWTLIVRNVVTLDVDLQNTIDDVDDDDLDEALGLSGDEESDSDDSEGDSESDNSDSEVDDEDADETNQPSDEEYLKSISSIKELSNKLDTIMAIIFDAISKKITTSSIEEGPGVSLFMTLMDVFSNVILPTHGTRITQYIMFYAAQLHHELNDAFIVLLFQSVFGSNQSPGDNNHIQYANSKSNLTNAGKTIPMIIRIKSAQYIASFVARGKSLSKDQLGHVIKLIVDWCSMYIKSVEENEFHLTTNTNNEGQPDSFKPYQGKTDNTLPARHPLLYALIQSLMYIICFRRKELRNDDGSWICGVDKFFTRLMVSKLDVLRWTNETVVLIFARVAQKEGLCYAWWGVEKLRKERVQNATNKSNDTNIEDKEIIITETHNNNTNDELNELNVTTEGSLKRTQELLDLEAWFPFDPLLLPRCKSRVKHLYVEWEEEDGDDESE